MNKQWYRKPLVDHVTAQNPDGQQHAFVEEVGHVEQHEVLGASRSRRPNALNEEAIVPVLLLLSLSITYSLSYCV